MVGCGGDISVQVLVPGDTRDRESLQVTIQTGSPSLRVPANLR